MKNLYALIKPVAGLFLQLMFINTGYAQICNQGKFYGVGNSTSGTPTAIYTLTFNGSTVTVSTTPTVPGPLNTGLGALAIADLGGGNTFYSSGYNPICAKKYNGGTWHTLWTDTSSSTIPLGNGAGNGSYLYYHSVRAFGWPNRITKFDGTTMTVLWEDTTTYMPVADMAVDDSGNLYFFTGANQFTVDALRIMSPAGVFLASIPITFDGLSCYGIFFMNNILYVAAQGSNVNFPYAMIPVTINGSTAVMGTPIAIPTPVIGTSSSGQLHLYFSDLAACGSTVINFTTGMEDELADTDFSIYPNPGTGYYHLTVPFYNGMHLKVMDAVGRMVLSKEISSFETAIDITQNPEGIYFVQVTSGNKTFTRKIVKQ